MLNNNPPPGTPTPEKKGVPTKIKIIITTGILAILSFVFFRLTFQSYRITGSSMENTILIGDQIVVNQGAYGVINPFTKNPIRKGKSPFRGDIVMFKYPKDPTKLFFKRVIGMPGETIQIRNGTVIINDQKLTEPYVLFKKEFAGLTARNMKPLKIPSDSFFLMGDNRNNSKDSRAWGPVNRNLIIGKAYSISLSFDAEKNRIRWERMGKVINNPLKKINPLTPYENETRVHVGPVPRDYKSEIPSYGFERRDIVETIRAKEFYYSDVIDSVKDSKEDISRLKMVLKSTQENDDIQIRAATLLFVINDKEGRNFLFEKLRDGSENIQKIVLNELVSAKRFSYQNKPPALSSSETQLILHISQHGNLEIRSKALEAAVTYEVDGLTDPLIAYLEEKKIKDRGKMVFWLAQTHDPKAFTYIIKCIESKPSKDEWGRIIQALHEYAEQNDKIIAERAVSEMNKYFLWADPKEIDLKHQNLVRIFCETSRKSSLPALERIHKISKDPTSKEYALEAMLNLDTNKYLPDAIAEMKSGMPGYYLLRGLGKIINDSNRRMIIEPLLQKVKAEPRIEKDFALFVVDYGGERGIKEIQENMQKMSPQTQMQVTWKINGWKADNVVADWLSAEELKNLSLSAMRQEYLDDWGDDFGEEEVLFYFLEKAGKLYSFDTETDELPARHDLLISELCNITAGKIQPDSIKEIWHQKDPKDYDADYTVEIVFRNKLYRFNAENLGDWYDVGIVLEALNLALQNEKIPQRFTMFEFEEQTAYVVFETPDRITKLASKYSIPLSSNPEEPMEIGEKFDEGLKKSN